MTIARAWMAALVLGACRFGGPTGDPTLPVADGAGGGGASGGRAGSAGDGEGGGAGSAGVGTGATAGAGGTSTGGTGGTTVDAGRDASDDGPSDIADDMMIDASLDGDASTDLGADVESDGASDSGPPTSCVPPFSSAVCDPVCNTGCPALFRCDVTDTARTGVCVGTLLSTVPEGMPCTRTALTDDCLERLSCVEGTCKRLCYRDADCTTMGTCCTGAIDVDGGASGYRACAPCGP